MNWTLGLAALAVAALAAGAGAQEPQPLKVGDKAPDFKLAGSDGKEYTAKQFHGKSWIAVAWYPKALTGG